MKKPLLTFDPRSKLCTVIFASIFLMIRLPVQVEVFFVSFLYLLFILNGALKKGTVYYVIFWGLFIGDLLLLPHLNNQASMFFSFLVVGNRRMLPIVMAASFAMNQTKISEWIAALKKCHVPFAIIVPLTVLFRFFPTIIQDFKSIRQAMKYRGIAVSGFDLIIHPFQTIEYILVPILQSAENTSLDLASAALVRGLAKSSNHTSIYELKLKLQDYLLIFFLIGTLIGSRWIH